jgi:hypothetical protein
MMIQKKISASPHDDCDTSLLHAAKLKNETKLSSPACQSLCSKRILGLKFQEIRRKIPHQVQDPHNNSEVLRHESLHRYLETENNTDCRSGTTLRRRSIIP